MLNRARFLSGAALAGLGSLVPGAAVAAWPIDAAGAESALRAAGLDDLIYPDRLTLAPPPRPFVSNHNYFIYGGGSPIVGLVVTIHFEEALVAPESMGMQLNANSKAGSGCVYQQYVMGMASASKANLKFGSSIENFPSNAFRALLHQTVGLRATGDLFNVHRPGFADYPNLPGGTIPAGYKIRYEIATDGSGAATGATYTVTDDNGRENTSGSMRILNFDFDHTTNKVLRSVLAPIYAVQMNMVGINGGKFTTVRSGKGTITYEARTMLVPSGTPPHTIAAPGTFTEESSNMLYSELGSTPSTKIVQRFHVNPNLTAGSFGGTHVCQSPSVWNPVDRRCDLEAIKNYGEAESQGMPR